MATIRQADAFNKVVESGGNMPIGKAMILAHYSKATAKTPQKLTESKGWHELLAEIDDDLILNRVKMIMATGDNRAALQAADMLLKLKSRYPVQSLKITAATEERNEIIG